MHRSEDSEKERQPWSAARPVCNLTPAVWKDRRSAVTMRGKVRGKKMGHSGHCLMNRSDRRTYQDRQTDCERERERERERKRES